MLRDRQPNKPTLRRNPVPSNEAVPGSGVVTLVGVSQLGVSMETVFVSSVTAPLRAKALPHPIFAPVFRVMLVRAKNIALECSRGAESC